MSANKARGTRWESAIGNYLRELYDGLPLLGRAKREMQEGHKDTGDIHGVSPWIIQAKDWKSWEAAIREGLDGAEKQRRHAGESYGVAFVKRARKGVGEAYAVQTVRTWALVRARLLLAEAMLTADQREELQELLDRL